MDWLQNLTSDEKKEWVELMISYAFDEDEWTSARATLSTLLQKDGKCANELAIRSYLSCCAESGGNVHPLPPLSSLVIDLYKAYGMDSAEAV